MILPGRSSHYAAPENLVDRLVGHLVGHLVRPFGPPFGRTLSQSFKFGRTLARPFGQAFGRPFGRKIGPYSSASRGRCKCLECRLAGRWSANNLFRLDGSHCSAQSQPSPISAPASVSLYLYGCPRVLAFRLEAFVCTSKEPKFYQFFNHLVFKDFGRRYYLALREKHY